MIKIKKSAIFQALDTLIYGIGLILVLMATAYLLALAGITPIII